MAFTHVIMALLFALALAGIDPSACQIVKGKISCNDCTKDYDFSGIKVSVKCEGVKNLAMTFSDDDGTFEVDLPSDHAKSPKVNCLVKLVGGPNQLYESKNQISQIVKYKDENSYTISTPLSVFKYCPQNTECKAKYEFGSSETFNFPVPPEWEFAPISYYFPFFPIIGIP